MKKRRGLSRRFRSKNGRFISRARYLSIRKRYAKKRLRARKSTKKRVKPRARKQVHRRAVSRTVWIKASDYRKALERKWKFDHGQSPPFPTWIKWFNHETKFLSEVRRYPPFNSRTRYNVFVAWFVIYDGEEDAYYLWTRKRAYKSPITLSDFAKVIPKGKSILDYSPDELNQFIPLLPLARA